MHVDEDIVDDGCYEEELGEGVVREKEVGSEVGIADAVVNEGDKSFITRITRTVLTDSGLVREGVGGRPMVGFNLDSCIHITKISSEWRTEDYSCRPCQIRF